MTYSILLSLSRKKRRRGKRRTGEEEQRGRQEEKRELERHHTRSSSEERDGDGALVWGWMFMFLKNYCGPCIREDMYKVYFNCMLQCAWETVTSMRWWRSEVQGSGRNEGRKEER